MIVETANQEACAWLGPDYPFVAATVEREALSASLDFAASSFGAAQ